MMRSNKFIASLIALLLIFGSTIGTYAYTAYDVVFTGAYDSTTRWISPLKNSSGTTIWGTVTSKWCEPRTTGTSPHVGVDLSVSAGKNVTAVQAGTATALGGTYNTLSLSRNGSAPYCHYEHMNPILKTGSCAQGDIVGTASDYGSEGSVHLHFGAYTTNSMSRLAYRNETFYRSASAWNYGRNVDVFSQSQFNGGRTAQITAVFSGSDNSNTEIPAEVRIYHRLANTATWVDGGLMTRSGYNYTYTFSTTTYPAGSNVQWMVRIKRNISITNPYTWAPAKYYNPSSNPNSTSQYTWAYFSNTVS